MEKIKLPFEILVLLSRFYHFLELTSDGIVIPFTDYSIGVWLITDSAVPLPPCDCGLYRLSLGHVYDLSSL